MKIVKLQQNSNLKKWLCRKGGHSSVYNRQVANPLQYNTQSSQYIH